MKEEKNINSLTVFAYNNQLNIKEYLKIILELISSMILNAFVNSKNNGGLYYA